MKGWEIMRELAEGKIKEGDRVIVKNEKLGKSWETEIKGGCLYVSDRCNYILDIISDKEFAMSECEIIPEEIDIQSITRLEEKDSETMNEEKIVKKLNEVIEGMKQLDRRLKENEK